jgi:hypothetical protein
MRYCRDVYKTRVVSDKLLVEKEQEETEFGGGTKVLRDYDSSHVSQKIKSLALYLMERLKEVPVNE